MPARKAACSRGVACANALIARAISESPQARGHLRADARFAFRHHRKRKADDIDAFTNN